MAGRHRTLLFAALVVAAGSCSHPGAAPEQALPVLNQVPDFTLTGATGQPFGSSQLEGKVWVADFIFTRCPTTCPIQTAMMKRLQEKLRAHPQWEKLRLVSFSVDPEYDVPDMLKQYAATSGAEPGHWKFLTGSRDAIWKLSVDGFKLAAGESTEGDGPLFHSTKFILVDSAGRIRGYYDGVSEEGIDALGRDLELHSSDLFNAR